MGKLLRLVLVYFSVVKAPRDKERNLKIKKEIEMIIENSQGRQEALMVLGDFNGHTGLLGDQREDENGRTVLEWMNSLNMILLNMDAQWMHIAKEWLLGKEKNRAA